MISAAAPIRADNAIIDDQQRLGPTATAVVQGEGEASLDDLQRLRSDLERLDRTVIELLGARQRIAVEVGKAKRAAGLPVVDPAQEALVLRRAAEQARAEGLAEEEIRRIFWCIIDLAREAQRAVLS